MLHQPFNIKSHNPFYYGTIIFYKAAQRLITSRTIPKVTKHGSKMKIEKAQADSRFELSTIIYLYTTISALNIYNSKVKYLEKRILQEIGCPLVQIIFREQRLPCPFYNRRITSRKLFI